MWIVRLALRRPYTFVVLAILILILGTFSIVRTPTDIFPNINIPVVSIIWSYNGLNAQDMSDRIVSVTERTLTTTVDNIEHIESQSLNGIAVVKIFFQPSASVERGIAQATAVSLNDFGLNFIRTRLITVEGAAVPYPYGGKQRQVQIDLDTAALQSKGLSPLDVVNAISAQNLILPSGTAKIGSKEYDVEINGSPTDIAGLNQLPIKTVGSSTIYIHDVGWVRDGFPPQTNIVRVDGQRSVLLTIQKAGNASTLNVISGIKALLPQIKASLPPELGIKPLADQSIFVRASIKGVIKEATIAACLTGLMILIFLGSWRSTLNRNIAQGKEIQQAILDGAQQIAVPAFVSTLCICIVFVPMFFLTGVARYLFVPLAESVVFAMLASYLLSRTLVPTMAKYLLRGHEQQAGQLGSRQNPLIRLQIRFEESFERLRERYQRVLESCLNHRRAFLVSVLAFSIVSLAVLVPFLGQDFFPTVDSGQFKLHLRAPTGTRIEETARLCDLVERSIRQQIPPAEVSSIIDNIGIPYSGINLSYSNSAPIGPADADILVSLATEHRPTDKYVHDLRLSLAERFPGVTFSFLPADIVSQILNFGLPAPIDVQVAGYDLEGDRRYADNVLQRIRGVAGTADLRIQQPFDQPELHIDVDRTKANEIGFTQRDVAQNLLVSLSGSFQTSPTFFLDPKSHVSYSIATQTPQYRVQSLQDLENIPVTGTNPAVAPEILGSLASVTRQVHMPVISHYDIRPVIDIYGSVQGRDLGAVSRQINQIITQTQGSLPRGSQVIVRGQVRTMRSSYIGLLAGLAFSIMLVYLLIVVNFQSWLDPFIIISALPAALAGIAWFLFVSGTTVSVPALTGAIMCMGVATANSILVVSFATEQMQEGQTAIVAALQAGYTRFRPVLMTALAMIIGMMPMALGLGEGGEQNAPLGRAVIGGLLFATVATLLFVPTLFSLLHGSRSATIEKHGENNFHESR